MSQTARLPIGTWFVTAAGYARFIRKGGGDSAGGARHRAQAGTAAPITHKEVRCHRRRPWAVACAAARGVRLVRACHQIATKREQERTHVNSARTADQTLRRPPGGQPGLAGGRQRRVFRAAGAIGQRQEHGAADDRRADGNRHRADRAARGGRDRATAAGPRRGLCVPELRAVPADDGRRQHRVCAAGPQGSGGGAQAAAGHAAGDGRAGGAGEPAAAPAVGGTAAKGGPGAGAGPPAGGAALGRAVWRAGRQDSHGAAADARRTCSAS